MSLRPSDEKPGDNLSGGEIYVRLMQSLYTNDEKLLASVELIFNDTHYIIKKLIYHGFLPEGVKDPDVEEIRTHYLKMKEFMTNDKKDWRKNLIGKLVVNGKRMFVNGVDPINEIKELLQKIENAYESFHSNVSLLVNDKKYHELLSKDIDNLESTFLDSFQYYKERFLIGLSAREI